MKTLLLTHYALYPQAQIQDFFKFIYQSEFGPGHLIKDPGANFAYLNKEVSDKADWDIPFREKNQLVDALGGNLCRIHLDVVNHGLNLTTLQRLFEFSAKALRGTVEGYFDKLEILGALCASGELPFSMDEFEQMMDGVRLEPKLAIHHTETFRQSYFPAYRVVDGVFGELLDVFVQIDALLGEKQRVIVAIDGDCGSGKSSLARLFAQIYGCNVIPMDDFFLPFLRRTPQRLAAPGGNIDYERFLDEVLTPLACDKAFSYRPFNCMTGDFDTAVDVAPKALTIVEGSYSQHPLLRDCYDLTLFISIDNSQQLERLLLRDGAALLERFISTWIPLEKQYHEAFSVKSKSMFSFENLKIPAICKDENDNC